MSILDTRNSAALAGVFVQTNERGTNRVLAFRRGADGALEPAGEYSTGGAGLGSVHLGSQGSVTLTGDGRFLLVTNAGSNDVAVLAVHHDGLKLVRTTPSNGGAPVSVTEHHSLVYVLNSGDPGLAGFTLDADGLHELPGSRRDLVGGRGPGAGRVLPGRRHGGGDPAGHELAAQLPRRSERTVGRPAGNRFVGSNTVRLHLRGRPDTRGDRGFRRQGREGGRVLLPADRQGLVPMSRSVGNGRSAICWAVSDASGRFVYATNYADGAVSRYEVSTDGSLTLADATAGTAVESHPGLRDEDLSGDGRYLYAIDADAHRIFGWRVEADGQLTSVGSRNGLPDSVAGLAAI